MPSPFPKGSRAFGGASEVKCGPNTEEIISVLRSKGFENPIKSIKVTLHNLRREGTVQFTYYRTGPNSYGKICFRLA